MNETIHLVFYDIDPFVLKLKQTVRKLLPILLDIIVEVLRLLLDAGYQDALGFGLESILFDDDVQLTHLGEASRDKEIHELH